MLSTRHHSPTYPDPITAAFFWRSKEDTLLKVDLDIDATDTNTKAEGTRSVKHAKTTVRIQKLAIDSPVSIP